MFLLPSSALTSNKSPYHVDLRLPILSTTRFSSVACPSFSAVGTPSRNTIPSLSSESSVARRDFSELA
jgi:hypothetical protein